MPCLRDSTVHSQTTSFCDPGLHQRLARFENIQDFPGIPAQPQAGTTTYQAGSLGVKWDRQEFSCYRVEDALEIAVCLDAVALGIIDAIRVLKTALTLTRPGCLVFHSRIRTWQELAFD